MNRFSNPSLRSFLSTADEFLEGLTIRFPNEGKLKAYLRFFRMQRKIHVRKPLEMFMEQMMPYSMQILTRDEEFFRTPDYVESIQTFASRTGLEDYWDSIEESFKQSIWEYIQNLYCLGMLCLNLQSDLEKAVEMAKEYNRIKTENDMTKLDAQHQKAVEMANKRLEKLP